MNKNDNTPTVTTDHATSSYGVPVILDGAGHPLDYPAGLRACMQALGWDKHALAERTGCSVRTVEGWLQGRMPEVAALNVIRDALGNNSANLR